MSQSPSGTDSPLAGVLNPFSSVALGSAWDSAPANVDTIHAETFATLLRLIAEQTASAHSQRNVLLYGDAGSGKTHMLQRVRLALQNRADSFIPFAWVRMYTSPSLMWRHLRRTLIEDLTRLPDSGGASQLERILVLRRDRIDAVEDRDLACVLTQWSEGKQRRDARAWLAGASLPEPVLAALAVAPRDIEDDGFEAESRRIVIQLAKLIHPAPLVLCLDQLEALQSHPGDQTGLYAIGKLLSTLFDECTRTVAIGCVQTGLLAELRASLAKSDQERFQVLSLSGLTESDARALVLARLATEPRIAEMRPPAAPDLWPISPSLVSGLLKSREGLTARKVLYECEQKFREAQSLSPATDSLPDRLQQQFDGHLADAQQELSPDISTGTLSDGLPRVLFLSGWRVRRDNLPPGVDSLCVHNDGRKRAVVIANEDPRQAWHKLDRVSRNWPETRELVILRDALHPIKPSATATRKRLADLEQRGATLLSPSREALAALEALRRLLADADSGELSFHGDALAVDDVESWVRASVPEALDELLEAVSGAPARDRSSFDLLTRLSAHLSEAKLAPIAQIAEALASSVPEVENIARQNPSQFGLLLGVQPVVFERIPDSVGLN